MRREKKSKNRRTSSSFEKFFIQIADKVCKILSKKRCVYSGHTLARQFRVKLHRIRKMNFTGIFNFDPIDEILVTEPQNTKLP